ncbi:MAG: histidine--tRNA ligase [Phycisphaerales bacterium]|nr:histidine--tRNA ligase [Phycisphaerales bacterium]
MTDAIVQPRLMRGLRDYLPEPMQARQWIIDTIRRVYELYAYVPLGTPAMEYLDVLTGTAGESSDKELFVVQGPDEERLGLRFDQTVSLARVVAQYPDLPRPFRRYQVQPVWRCDNPYEKRGRFREFIQFDIDAVGVESALADLEMITAMCDTMSALHTGPYRVRVSSRRVLTLLLKYARIPEARAADVFRVLDKLDKLGHEKVRLELTAGYKDESGSPVPGLGLGGEQVDRIDTFLAACGTADRQRAGEGVQRRDAALARIAELFREVDGAEAELAALAGLSRQLAALGYGDDRVVFDFSIARGLAYYTGTVFETELCELPEFGSVCSGGRYDDLVARFLGEKVPAVGTSVGVDRMLVALLELGRAPLRKATAQVLVTTLDDALTDDYLAMTYELRRAGVRTEMYHGMFKRFGKQVQYGDRYEIPILVVCGSDEKARGVVQLKDMAIGRQLAAEKKLADKSQWRAARPGQFDVPRGELVAAVRKLLAEIGA